MVLTGFNYAILSTQIDREIQLGAGVLLDDFGPETGDIGSIIGTTSGGVTFSDNPEYVDYGTFVDNCEPNLRGMLRIRRYDPVLSGTLQSVNRDTVKLLDTFNYFGTNPVNYSPADLSALGSYYQDLWFVGDYGVNSAYHFGLYVELDAHISYIAVHLKDAVNRSGFNWQSADNSISAFSFEFHATRASNGALPFEVFLLSPENS